MKIILEKAELNEVNTVLKASGVLINEIDPSAHLTENNLTALCNGTFVATEEVNKETCISIDSRAVILAIKFTARIIEVAENLVHPVKAIIKSFNLGNKLLVSYNDDIASELNAMKEFGTFRHDLIDVIVERKIGDAEWKTIRNRAYKQSTTMLSDKYILSLVNNEKSDTKTFKTLEEAKKDLHWL